MSKRRDLAQKIAEVKAEVKVVEKAKTDDDDSGKIAGKPARIVEIQAKPHNRMTALTNDRVGTLVVAGLPEQTESETQSEAAVMQQFNSQFQHFQDDAPACDICGSITVRNGSCYKCFNCGNSMGCS